MTDERVRDPVCGMRFTPDRETARLDLNGRTVHFCCRGCREVFEADPRRFLQFQRPAGRRP